MCLAMANWETLEWRRRKNFSFFFGVCWKIAMGVSLALCISIYVCVSPVSLSPPGGEGREVAKLQVGKAFLNWLGRAYQIN